MWIEEKQQLISCSKDKSIKVWKLPLVWYDEERVRQKLREEEEKNQPPATEAKQQTEQVVVDMKATSKVDSKQASAEKSRQQRVNNINYGADEQVH